jgi:hypothetical protein
MDASMLIMENNGEGERRMGRHKIFFPDDSGKDDNLIQKERLEGLKTMAVLRARHRKRPG